MSAACDQGSQSPTPSVVAARPQQPILFDESLPPEQEHQKMLHWITEYVCAQNCPQALQGHCRGENNLTRRPLFDPPAKPEIVARLCFLVLAALVEEGLAADAHVPFHVEQRMVLCSLRELVARGDGATQKWNQIALCLANLEGGVPQELEDDFRRCHRKAQLLAAQQTYVEMEDEPSYRAQVERICDGIATDDRDRFLAVKPTREGYSVVAPEAALFVTLGKIVDALESGMPQPALVKVWQDSQKTTAPFPVVTMRELRHLLPQCPDKEWKAIVDQSHPQVRTFLESKF